ncbi:MAG: (2Fe-2S)-binding protein [Proteobacteria bacterium]|nr:(2Fe-2S)-binding protein [Pseudomonadota bacterium]
MSGAPNRLPAPAGLLVDRDRPIGFRFEGRAYRGFAGDTIASALAANGVKVLSRSFKYHRPRGILTMAGQDANTLVQLEHEPNVLADRHPISEGLEVRAQNVAGSLKRDWGALLGLIGGFMPVGFYYRAFFRPRGIFEKFWEPIIRRSTGLGKVDLKAPRGYYDKAYGFCDVAVVGGGPAGLEAALTAARAGAKVLLIEENPVLGGSLSYARFDVTGAQKMPGYAHALSERDTWAVVAYIRALQASRTTIDSDQVPEDVRQDLLTQRDADAPTPPESNGGGP